MRPSGPVFPLIPRQRVVGLPFGEMPSGRRGSGYEVAGSRPYVRGDDIRRIDRYASARLSSATDRDEFVVREHYAEEAAYVAVAVDRGPTMELFPEEFPWLQKQNAVAAALRMIADSAVAARSVAQVVEPPPDHGDGGVAASLRALTERTRRLPPGTFVFFLSDFLSFPPEEVWADALARRWDLVPVVIQDPLWEQTFPDVAGAVLPIFDPASGRFRVLRLRRSEARARREANEARLAAILGRFEAMGIAPVRVSRHDSGSVHASFLAWADERRRGRRSPW
jgi:uncharacterized protein (DUF58 family)